MACIKEKKLVVYFTMNISKEIFEIRSCIEILVVNVVKIDTTV